MNNIKVRSALDAIVEAFKEGSIPEAVACSMFPIPAIPANKWSLLNRTLMFFSGTHDARGFRQWKTAGRHINRKAKAIYILVPYMRKVENKDTREKQETLVGFGCKPVFRVEDTRGEPLDYEQIELPELPLTEKAKQWGISIKAIPGNYLYYGYYSKEKKEIALATPEEKTFFHELAHAGHEKVNGSLKAGQDPLQEIVAELSAQALCRLVGRQADDTLGNSYRYIERYAEKLNMTAHGACLKVLSETEKVLDLILKG